MNASILGSTARTALALTAWAAALAGALAIAQAPGDWGHALCGPWGCGPTMQALLACHLAWIVLLVPPAKWITQSTRVSEQQRRTLGWLIALTAGAVLLAVAVHQAVVWLPSVSERYQAYFLQRCGFVVITAVDLPMLELLGVGLYVALSRERVEYATG